MTYFNTFSINPFAAGSFVNNFCVYQAPQTVNFMPLFNFGGGFDVSQYFGTMPVFSQPQFNFDWLYCSFFNAFQPLTYNIQNILNNIIKPQTVTTPQPKKCTTSNSNSSSISSSSTTPRNYTLTQTVYNPPIKTTLANDTTSELKPGLFKGRLAGQEALVTRLSHKYGVSPALVASIIGLESAWGTSNLAMHNNFGGYRAAGDLGKNEKGFGYFSTIEKGLDAMIRNLANYTRYSDVAKVDFDNLDNIGRHYCEGNTWSSKIRQVYSTRVCNYLA